GNIGIFPLVRKRFFSGRDGSPSAAKDGKTAGRRLQAPDVGRIPERILSTILLDFCALDL
ncbi:MAG TPA: hypothetical protein PLN61_10895, partial [bacterium]|nr:hypothetical protein [bacterium]